MSKTYRTCPECGARLAAAAERCDLCGSPVEAVDAPEPVAPEAVDVQEAADVPETEGARVGGAAVEEANASVTPAEATTADPESPSPPAARADRPVASSGVYCNQCGWKNPPGARFCSMCGARVEVLEATSPPPDEPSPTPPERSEDVPELPKATPVSETVSAVDVEAARDTAPAVVQERRAVTRQVGIIVGAGFLLVIALFLVTAVSKSRSAATTPSPSPATSAPAAVPEATAPLPAQLVEQVEALEAEIAQLDGEARIGKQRDLVALFVGAGRLDRAAQAQLDIVEVTGAADDWKRAGDLFYDWMETMPEARRDVKAQVAAQAIEAYQRVLAEDPDNLDVRTDMATAYLNSDNPMQAVTEIKRVLDADPDHIHARFNYGIMLTMIGRAELAIEQFEHVKTLVDESTTYYRQAEEAIGAIRSGGIPGS